MRADELRDRQHFRGALRRTRRRKRDDGVGRAQVDADVIGEIEAGHPDHLLDELEVRRTRIEIGPQAERHQEGDGGHPKGDRARIAGDLFGRTAAE